MIPDRLAGKFGRSPLLDLFAGRYKVDNRFDDCLLFNQLGYVVGSIYSTIFIRIKKKIYTPPLRDGSPSSVIREQVMSLLAAAGDPVNDNLSLRTMDIEKADEILLANTTEGIRWVVAMDRLRYYNHTGAGLTNSLNEKAFGSD